MKKGLFLPLVVMVVTVAAFWAIPSFTTPASKGLAWLLSYDKPHEDSSALWLLHELNQRYCRDTRIDHYIRTAAERSADTPTERAYYSYFVKGFSYPEDMPSATARGYDGLLLSALSCRPETLSDAQKVAESGGYALTHAYLALLYMEERGCILESEQTSFATLKDTFARAIAEAQSTASFDDLYAERVAFLLLGGSRALVQKDWLTTIVENQDTSGGWATYGITGPNPHTTALAVFALAAYHDTCPDTFSKAATEEEDAVLTFSTEPISLLGTHHHGAGDSVQDHGHGVVVRDVPFTLSEDIWVRGLELWVENGPTDLLHHANIIVEYEGQVSGISMGKDVGATHILPYPYATRIPKDATLTLDAMLHNPTPPEGPGGTYENVSVQLSLILAEDTRSLVKTNAIQLLLTDHKKGSDAFAVPARTKGFIFSEENGADPTYASYTFREDATILAVGGHIHAWEGGKKLEVLLNGEPLRSFVPYRSGPNPWEWSTPSRPLRLHVQKGDTLSLRATYDNDTEIARPGVMGSAVITYAPTSPLKNPFETLSERINVLIPRPSVQ